MRLAPFLALAAILTTPLASARSATLEGRTIALKGDAHGAPACSACHGPNGEGNAQAGFPRLAGLNADYIARELDAFAAATRPSAVMTPVAKTLTAEERKALADYFANLPTQQGTGETEKSALATAGAELARRGDWAKGLPGCGQCHGVSGLGVGADFPALAGQNAIYIVAQLQAFRQGARKDDPMGLMTGVAAKLSDGQIKAAAAYYASLPIHKAASSSAAAPSKDQQP